MTKGINSESVPRILLKGEMTMNFSFHYYGTYCAAVEAGFSSDDAWIIAHAAQFVDDCSKTLLSEHGMNDRLPTYHTEKELLKLNIGWFGSPVPNEIPQVWIPFHFLPGNFTEEGKFRLSYRNPKFVDNPEQTALFKLMCLPYGHMSGKIVDKAKQVYLSTDADNTPNKKLCYIGMVMHVLADTFAHEYFVGAPSEAINECSWITEFKKSDELKPYALSTIRECSDKHKPNYIYSPALSSTSVGWLGHGRAGNNPDIPNKRYYYTPNWNTEAECVKDNPLLHMCAFFQMKNAMKFILDTAVNDSFDYTAELTADEYDSEYGSKLINIFTSDGDEINQKRKWSQHILDTYDQIPIEHDCKALASDNIFLNDFVDNADKHRNMVCTYCKSTTFPTLKYF